MLSRQHFLILISGFLIAMAFSCHKPESIPRQSTYTFDNQTGRDVTFDVYNTEKDYADETGRLLRYSIPAGDDRQIVFDVGQTYWIDWYSADYSYNNWETVYNGAAPEPRLLPAAAVDNTLILTARNPDTTRSVLLNGATSSKWKGIMMNGGFWDGTYEFVFRKDFSGDYTYTDLSGAKTTQQITYNVNGVNILNKKIGRFTLHIRDEQHTGIFSAACLMWDFPPQTGRDSLFMEHYNSNGEFTMVRQ